MSARGRGNWPGLAAVSLAADLPYVDLKCDLGQAPDAWPEAVGFACPSAPGALAAHGTARCHHRSPARHPARVQSAPVLPQHRAHPGRPRRRRPGDLSLGSPLVSVVSRPFPVLGAATLPGARSSSSTSTTTSGRPTSRSGSAVSGHRALDSGAWRQRRRGQPGSAGLGGPRALPGRVQRRTGRNTAPSQSGLGLSRPGVMVTALGANPDGRGCCCGCWETGGPRRCLPRPVAARCPGGHTSNPATCGAARWAIRSPSKAAPFESNCLRSPPATVLMD